MLHKTLYKDQKELFGFMNVILLHSDHQYVSATRVAIFRVVRARMQIYL